MSARPTGDDALTMVAAARTIPETQKSPFERPRSMSSRSVPSPESVGRFKVDAVLGAGGMGEVYKATDPTLRRTVAVKTVRPDISNPDYLDRLVREAQACASLQHPNIVTVYEAGKIDGA